MYQLADSYGVLWPASGRRSRGHDRGKGAHDWLAPTVYRLWGLVLSLLDRIAGFSQLMAMHADTTQRGKHGHW